MFRNLKLTWRILLKNKTTSFLNIAGLSIGMASAVLIFIWVQNERNFDSYHPNVNQIFRVTLNTAKTKSVKDVAPFPFADKIQEEVPEVEKVTRLTRGYSQTINIKGSLFTQKNFAYVDNKWFDIFHYDFIEGNAASFVQHPFGVVLTKTEAKKYFGNRDAIGQIIRIDTINYEVSGVVSDNPSNSSFQFDMLFSVNALQSNPQQKKGDESWRSSNYITFIEVRKDAVPITVNQKLTSIFQRNRGDNDATVSLTRMTDIHLESGLTISNLPGGNSKTVYIFSILGMVLLAIACINYINLTTARANLRLKEVGIKKITGATRWLLFVQFIVESLFINLISLVITLLIVWQSLPFFSQLTENNFSFSSVSTNSLQVLLWSFAAMTVLNSIYPALLLSSFKPLNVFKSVSLFNVKNETLRKGLITFQFVISVTLIVCTIVLFRQMKFIQQKDVGYNRSHVLSVILPYKYFLSKYDDEGKVAVINTFKQELMSQASIDGVSAASHSIINIASSSTSADWDGRDTAFIPVVSNISADVDFQKVFGLQLENGRWFRDKSKPDEHNFILNETATREFNLNKPIIGQRFTFRGDTGQIIGIVKDFQFKSMHDKITSLAISNKPLMQSAFFIRTKNGQLAQALAATERTWKKFISAEPFQYTFLDESFDKMHKKDAKISQVIFSFTVIAIIICVLGLLGLAAFTAERRLKEISIRKILGASLSTILFLLSKEFLKLVVVAAIIAFPISWYFMSGWLEDFAYRVKIEWWIFILAGIIAVFITLLTVSFQTIRAAFTNPAKNLRTE